MTEKDRPDEQANERIKVVDRRKFTAAGERRSEVDEEEEERGVEPAREDGPPAAEATKGADAATQPGFEHRSVEDPPGVDFTMLINAMAQPALLYLGEIPHPSTKEPMVDLTQARLQIDMLELMRVKCRGNLTREEDGLLDQVLYQLRMLYVARSGGSS